MRQTPAELIAQCRENLGAAPRSFSSRDRQTYLRVRRPWWLRSKDALIDVIEQQDLLLERGIVVWASIVQANNRLFKPGRGSLPAAVLYCADPEVFDDRPDELRDIAGELFSTKGKQMDDSELQAFSDMLASELDREMRMPVPRSLAGSAPLYCTDVLVSRRHLPNRRLDRGLLPLIVLPDRSATMILPSRFWPDELLAVR
ncbi:hypothetical protein OG407_24480 [Streptomyces sp. NBC_01515]|uniref:hypothetical protein n=1 Tax=Streptomyces sp. NBC_01515 TaxID=2903890 RepID=UPI0038703E51